MTVSMPALPASFAAATFVAIPPVPNSLPAPPAQATAALLDASTTGMSRALPFYLGSP